MAVSYREILRWDVAGFVNIGWQWPKEVMRPLGEVVRQCSNECPPNTPKVELPIIEKITFGGQLFITPEDERKNYKGRLFYAHPGQLVYSKIRVKQGSFCIVPSDIPSLAVSTEYPVFDIDEELIQPEFLALVLRCDYFKKHLDAISHGGGTKTRIHPEQFGATTVPVPSPEIQVSIVINWKTATSEAEQAEVEAVKLESDAQAAFLNSLGLHAPNEAKPRRALSLPRSKIERWGVALNQPAGKVDVSQSTYPIAKLGKLIADLENGWSPKCLDRPAEGEEWGVLKLGAVSFGIFNGSENKGLPASLEPQPRLEVQAGDWLISRANIARLVGACALVPADSPRRLMLCDKIFRAVWKKDQDQIALPAYLDAALKIPHLRQQIESALTGTSPTMKNISKPSLLALQLPCPPVEIQRQLVNALATARQSADQLRTKAKNLRATAKVNLEAALLGQSLPENAP